MLKNSLPPEPLPIISPIGTVYTTEETATVLKVSVRTVQRLIRNKNLVGRKVGSAYRILGKDIEAFFAHEPSSADTPA
jgi:excisionase family DNA binding protein